jgi:hypothetical protein
MRAGNIRAPLRLACAIARVGVDVDLSRLSFKAEIVRVLASFALLADASLEIGAKY